jgi:hypothetical protein
MVPYDEARPPLGDIQVRKVALRFLREQVLPIVDERGACIGVVFAEDCSEVLCYLPSLPWNPIIHKCLSLPSKEPDSARWTVQNQLQK